MRLGRIKNKKKKAAPKGETRAEMDGKSLYYRGNAERERCNQETLQDFSFCFRPLLPKEAPNQVARLETPFFIPVTPNRLKAPIRQMELVQEGIRTQLPLYFLFTTSIKGK
ncbi:hypothetical protein [Rufibacter latericius]|uniref:Uncharacterized protein n=1 Tax=Rufibacter latericius TaxID=2487040 RepID=A0A3M9MLP4_9BACT|nr:hypothetical protein [Rufibacter latericius]RNI26470.1 hypothetical protein EFB08_11675 [Rufibacter latericius]